MNYEAALLTLLVALVLIQTVWNYMDRRRSRPGENFEGR